MEERKNFQITLAGRTIQISALYGSTGEFMQDYLCVPQSEQLQEPQEFSLDDFSGTLMGPYIDFQVKISPEDILYEREESAREDALEGIPLRQFSDAYLETLAVYRKIAERMIDYDTLLFHGSVLAMDGEGYLFTAKSGTGKSTHARLWREQFRERVVMINDDKPLLRFTDEEVWACGTPWDGKHHLSNNLSVPLKAICILERGEDNQIMGMTKRDAFPILVQQSYRPEDAAALTKVMGLLDRLASKVCLYRLTCNMEPEAAQVAYHGMNPDL